MLHGSIDHISITVSDLPKAMQCFGSLLEFLGDTVGEIFRDDRSGHDLTVNINQPNGTAFNIWQKLRRNCTGAARESACAS